MNALTRIRTPLTLTASGTQQLREELERRVTEIEAISKRLDALAHVVGMNDPQRSRLVTATIKLESLTGNWLEQ